MMITPPNFFLAADVLKTDDIPPTLKILNSLSARKFSTDDLKRAESTNDKTRQALFDKYQKFFPNAEIDDNFLFDIRYYERACKACAKCTGYPCTKSQNKGVTFCVKQVGNKLKIENYHCKAKKIAEKQAAAAKRFELAKIPPLYVNKTFADYVIDAKNQSTVDAAKELQSLYICGSPGTGKTFLAAIMAQEFLKQGKSVIFGEVPILLDQLKATFNDNSKATLEELMKTLSEVDVLVMDDLGTETPTDWAVERLFSIVNARYNAQKTMIVTSNYTPDELERRLNAKTKNHNTGESVTGSRIIDRIAQICKLTRLGGESRRS